MNEHPHRPPHIGAKYDSLAASYDKDYTYRPDARGLVAEAYDIVTWALLEPCLPAGGERRPVVLDAGGGTGKWALKMIHAGCDVHVIDLSQEMLGQARAKAEAAGIGCHLTVATASVTEIPYPADTFDLVLCEGDPISYCLDEHAKAVQELVRVAIPGACVVSGVDNLLTYFWLILRFSGLDAALATLNSRRGLCPYGLPIHAFTPTELTRLFDAAGADLIKVGGKPLLTTQLLAREPALAATIAGSPDLRKRWLEAELQLSGEGYGEVGGHLQIVARKRG